MVSGAWCLVDVRDREAVDAGKAWHFVGGLRSLLFCSCWKHELDGSQIVLKQFRLQWMLSDTSVHPRLRLCMQKRAVAGYPAGHTTAGGWRSRQPEHPFMTHSGRQQHLIVG